MDQKTLLIQLEELAQSLGIGIRYERFTGDSVFSPGGLCRIKDKNLFIINSRATTQEKVQTLARELSRFDFSSLYVRPALREYLESQLEEES